MPKPSKGPRLGGSPANERKIIANLCKSIIDNEYEFDEGGNWV